MVGARSTNRGVSRKHRAKWIRGKAGTSVDADTAEKETVDPTDEIDAVEPSMLRRLLTWLRRPVNSLMALIVVGALGVIGHAIQPTVTSKFCDWVENACAAPDHVTVVANEDKVKDAKGSYIGGIYLAERDPADWPALPDASDSCVGRYAWAHNQLDAVDAAATVANVDITAGAKTVTVKNITPEITRLGDPPAWNTIGCAGKGGGDRGLRKLTINLDAQQVEETIPSGGAVGARSDIDPGKSLTYLVEANTAACDCSWRLVVTLEIAGETRVETIGPDGSMPGLPKDNPTQRAFRTVATSQATIYRYGSGRWQRSDSNQAPAVSAVCKLLRSNEVGTALGLNLQPSDSKANGSVTGPSGHPMTEQRCVWSAPRGDNMNVVLDSLDSAGQAHEEFDAFFKALKQAEPSVSARRSVTGLGDEAGIVTTDDSSVLVAREGSRLVTLLVSSMRNGSPHPLDESIAVRLLRLANGRL